MKNKVFTSVCVFLFLCVIITSHVSYASSDTTDSKTQLDTFSKRSKERRKAEQIDIDKKIESAADKKLKADPEIRIEESPLEKEFREIREKKAKLEEENRKNAAEKEASKKIYKSNIEEYRVYDPLESLNRRIYYFNYGFDKYIFIPVVKAYQFITPKFVQKGVHNFFRNNKMITTTTNSILQLKVKKAMRAIGRFSMNVTAGFGGVVDTASSMGMPVPYEDFGLTLAHYGVGDGPYLMLPLLGPSNLRDGLGKAVDSISPAYIDPYDAVGFFEINSAPLTILNGVDTKSNSSFRFYQTGSPFEYEYLRFIYKRYRDIQRASSSK